MIDTKGDLNMYAGVWDGGEVGGQNAILPGNREGAEGTIKGVAASRSVWGCLLKGVAEGLIGQVGDREWTSLRHL